MIKSDNYKIHKAWDERKSFRLPYDYVPEMNKAREDYVKLFFGLIGYEITAIKETLFAEVFSLLARLDEYKTFTRHNGHNWEPDFAPVKDLPSAMFPVIESKISQWVAEGLLRPRKNFNPLWPGGKRFALCLTHDVDSISTDVFWSRLRSLPAFREAPFREKAIVSISTLRALVKKFGPRGNSGQDILWSEWLEAEGKHGFKSTFCFLPQPLPAPHWEDSFYRYSDLVIFDKVRMTLSEVMQEMVRLGWDVGLHGSTLSSYSQALLEKEREIVSETCGQEVITTRQHHLIFDVRYTPLFQTEAGLKADSTLGSNLRTSFRCGTGLPFFWYDLINEKSLDILEVPLAIQDVALFRVLQMDEETALRHCLQMLHRIADLGGGVTLLWHNNYQKSDVEFRVYQILLEEAAHLGAWGCSLRELNQWWRTRANLLSSPKTAEST